MIEQEGPCVWASPNARLIRARLREQELRDTRGRQRLYLGIGIGLALAYLLAFFCCTAARSQPLVRLYGQDGTNQTSPLNPFPEQLSFGNAPLSSANPLPSTLSVGGAPATAANPLQVDKTTSVKATYAYTVAFFTPYATPTDIIGIVGSATKTVKIVRIVLDSTQTTAGVNSWFLAKRSTADTGGSPSTLTACPLDSNNAAATATVKKYTAAPTTGNLVANVASRVLESPGAASVYSGEAVIFDDSFTGQPIVLRGTAQELDLNFNGAAVPAGLSMSATIYATEE